MAKQSGILPLIGTLDGVNYYMRKGKPFARKANGGFTAKAIKKSPNMIRVRETYTEFGNTSHVKKIFKNSLSPFFGNQKDETLHSRMMQLFLKIKDCDPTSARGKRQVSLGLQTTEGKHLLTSFDFTPHPLVLPNSAYSDTTFTYTVNDFNLNTMYFRNGATHIELCLGILVFDFEILKATLFASDALTIAKGTPLTNFSLTPAETPVENGMHIAIIGYRYVQELNGEFYPLKDKMVYGLRVVEITD